MTVPARKTTGLPGPDAASAMRRRTRALARLPRGARPPFPPERFAARFSVAAIVSGPPARGGPARRTVTVDRSLPPHTPQWNGAVALGLARTLLPPGIGGETAEALAVIGAAELLLPMAVFRPLAARTDLTLDGLRDLAVRFAAPIRLVACQWLHTGTWRGYALLWREEGGVLRLGWRAASPDVRVPRALALGAGAADVFGERSRIFAVQRTGRPHHGVEEVRTGSGPAWWFTRFGVVRDATAAAGGAHAAGPGGARPSERAGGRAVLALVVLTRGE